MIRRNFLSTLLVLLAGLTAGYFIARWTKDLSGKFELHVTEQDQLLMSGIFERETLAASSAVLSNNYFIAKDNFREVLDEGHKAAINAAEYEIEVYRVLNYYMQFFLNYFRWIDTGDPGARTDYLLALGQFKAVKEYHEEKFGADMNTPEIDFEEVDEVIPIVENAASAIRWAKVFVVVVLFMLILGIPRFIRDRAHRKFAGTLLFDALFRPNLITRLNAYHNVGRLALFMSLLYLLALLAFTSFHSLIFFSAIAVSGLIFVIILGLLFNSGRDFGKIFISLMGPKLLILIIFLIPVAIRGPFYFWYHIWVSDLFMVVIISLFIMLIFRKHQIYIILGKKWLQRGTTASAGLVFLVLGIQLLIVGAALQFFGLEESLTAINDELLVLPVGFSNISGIAEYLNIPVALPLWIISFAGGLTVSGFLLFRLSRKRTADVVSYKM